MSQRYKQSKWYVPSLEHCVKPHPPAALGSQCASSASSSRQMRQRRLSNGEISRTESASSSSSLLLARD